MELFKIAIFYVFIYSILIFLHKKNFGKLKIYLRSSLLFFSKFGINTIRKFKILKIKIIKYFISALGIFFVFYSFYILLTLVKNAILVRKPLEVSIPIPGTTVSGFYLPVIEGTIALLVTTMIHEFSHGVIAENLKVKVKNTGVGMIFFLIPVAFVELSQSCLKKLKEIDLIAIFSSGPLANLFVALIALAILNNILYPLLPSVVEFRGIKIEDVKYFSPAYNASLRKGIIINKVNNESVLTMEDFIKKLYDIKPFSNVSFSGPNGTFYITPIESKENKSKAFFGIKFTQYYEVKGNLGYAFLKFFHNLFFWIYILSIGIGLTNFLPLPISDGGQITYSLLKKFLKENLAKKISIFVYSITTSLILLGVLLPRVLVS